MEEGCSSERLPDKMGLLRKACCSGMRALENRKFWFDSWPVIQCCLELNDAVARVSFFLSSRKCFLKFLNRKATVIERDCEVSLHLSSQQPPGINIKCDRLQP